ncbi:MAG: hypothetical protein Q9160_007656 [Pyrenula sp. 1 TL-2023]
MILVIQRYRAMSKIKVSMKNEAFWFYTASILDLHSRKRELRNSVWIAGPGSGHSQKSEGMWRLSTLNSSRLSYRNKYGAGFNKAKFFGSLVAIVLLLYQGISASITYIGRLHLVENGTLSMDHLTGIYAICGTLIELAALVIIIQPYDWFDNNDYIKKERDAMPDVDTSNAWVYEGFLAIILHGLIWISLRFRIYFSALRKRATQDHDSTLGSLLIDSFSAAGIATAILIILIGIPLMTPTIWEVIFKPSRNGYVWLSRKIHLNHYRGGVAFRLLLAVVSATVSALIWYHAIQEAINVRDGRTESWNEAWKVPNPSADTFYGVILSLWS